MSPPRPEPYPQLGPKPTIRLQDQSASLPANPSLVAILLITRSLAGPRLVFHYPPKPSSNSHTKRDPNWYGTPGNQTEESGGSDDDWSSSDGDERGADESDEESSRNGSGTAGSRGSRMRSSARTRSHTGPGVGSEVDEETLDRDHGHHRGGDGDGGAQEAGNKKEERAEREWDRLLGFSADGLSALLSPMRSFDKKKFEVGIEQFVFVGAPIFVREDGFWKKRRRHRKRESVGVNGNGYVENSLSGNENNAKTTAGNGPEEPNLEQIPGYDAAYGHGLVSGAASELGSDQKSTSTAAGHGEMFMFSVVFVLNPPALEHHIRIDEMYDFIIKRFAKALKYEQAQNNYIAHEARLIMTMKEKGRENKAPIATLWPHIIDNSALAKSISIIFNQISDNAIAHINLNGFDTSFQIPQVVSTPFIPTATEPQMPGLWLTTASLIDDDESDASLSPHSALLLLEDDDSLLREIESDVKELSGPLSFFIRNLTPTKSLLKLSQRHSMPLKDLQFLARHLIYWRRARAIPPLHWRDTYVVSPNADLKMLSTAMISFAARFPTLPPLTKILNMLSGPPRQFRSHMPSQDHRERYMEILAWLMRGGWVTQLRTFAWVRVNREVKAAVAAKANREARHSLTTRINIDYSEETNGHHTENSTRSSSPQIQRSPDNRGIDASQGYASPHLSPYRYPAAPLSDAGSTSSSRTAVQSSVSALSPLQRPESRTLHRPSPLHINQSASPSSASVTASSDHTSSVSHSNTHPGLEIEFKSENPGDYEPSLVHSPQKASHEESAWIEHIGGLVPGLFDDAPEIGDMWPGLLKYFDGRYALEEISGREGLKKKRVREFLAGLNRNGVLVQVRHW